MNQTVVRAGSVKRCGPREDGRLEVNHVGTWDVLVGAGLLTDGMAVAPCRARHASESNSGTTVVRADTVVRGKGAGTSSPHRTHCNCFAVTVLLFVVCTRYECDHSSNNH